MICEIKIIAAEHKRRPVRKADWLFFYEVSGRTCQRYVFSDWSKKDILKYNYILIDIY